MAVELQQTCIVLATLKLIDRHNPNGAQQTSRLKFGVFGFHVRLSETLFWRELLVADNSVKPVVCDFDFELISLGPDGIRDFNTPRSRPDDIEILTIQPYAGDATQLSEVEVNRQFGNRSRQVKVLSISSDSTVVAERKWARKEMGSVQNGTNLRGEDGFLIVILILLLITPSSPQITQ